MRNLLDDILFIAAEAITALRTRKSWYKYLGNFWFVHLSYWPPAIGFGVDFDFDSRDEFSVSVDIGPFTATAGRDWAVEL
jgi:hypothetical protein